MTPETLSGRYTLEERIGQGGFSNVYRAEDRILERAVAVKVLAEHLGDDERFVARFRREALAVAKLIHPNIVQVYDTGVHDWQHYLVMELVHDGVSCAELLRDSPPSPDLAIEIVLQAKEGLRYAHQRGVIHRDVKPSNLMIASPEGEVVVKVTDFGIAAITDLRPIATHEPMGTKGYLCPEAWWDEPATPRFDVYALGVVAHQLLFGSLPVRDSAGEIVPPADRAVGAEVEALLPVLARALADSPGERFGSCHSFARELLDTYSAALATEP